MFTTPGKADVWAVGALLYAMAVGDPAPAELATASRAKLVSLVGHQTGSEALSLVAHRVLDPDPASRPSVYQVPKRKNTQSRINCGIIERIVFVLFKGSS